MSFADDLATIVAKQEADRVVLAKASTDAADAMAKASGAVAEDSAQDAGIVAADAKAQQALDEIAALTAALAANPPTP